MSCQNLFRRPTPTGEERYTNTRRRPPSQPGKQRPFGIQWHDWCWSAAGRPPSKLIHPAARTRSCVLHAQLAGALQLHSTTPTPDSTPSLIGSFASPATPEIAAPAGVVSVPRDIQPLDPCLIGTNGIDDARLALRTPTGSVDRRQEDEV